MANPALGTKRICSGCAAKFYDLGKDPIVCPTCDTVFVIPKPEPARGGRKYAPRNTYDPKIQSADPMGILKEADAPALAADDADDKEGAGDDAGETETVEAEEGEAEAPGGVPMLEEFDEK